MTILALNSSFVLSVIFYYFYYYRLQTAYLLVGYLVPARCQALPDHQPEHHQQQGDLPHEAQGQGHGQTVSAVFPKQQIIYLICADLTTVTSVLLSTEDMPMYCSIKRVSTLQAKPNHALLILHHSDELLLSPRRLADHVPRYPG